MDELYEQKLQTDLKKMEAYIEQLEKPRTQKMVMSLILKYSLDSHVAAQLSQPEMIEKVLALKFLHLEWLRLDNIDGLEICENLETLYLQHNYIRKIENLQFNSKLQFLALHHNQIESIENLLPLTKLLFLDLSSNCISKLEVAELPKSLVMLLIRDNPCSENWLSAEFREPIVLGLEQLQTLDEVPVTMVERMFYEGKVKLDFQSYLREKGREEATRSKVHELKQEPELSKDERNKMLEQLRELEEIVELQEEAKEMLEEAEQDFREKKEKVDEIKHLVKQEVLRQDEARREQLDKIKSLQEKLDAERAKRKG